MPYIKQIDREFLANGGSPRSAGELNYAITLLMIQYYENCGKNYNAINDVMGAAQNAALEFYRRIAADYEDKKIVENGDVYPSVVQS